ncbi:MAG: hypothetical protein U0935_07205 [Pirellulales bacterium]
MPDGLPDDITVLVTQSAIYFARAPDEHHRKKDGHEMFAPGGEKRLDELVARFGLDFKHVGSFRRWQQVEKLLGLFASEIRFRVFQESEDACHSALGVTKVVLQKLGYVPRPGENWGTFERQFLAELRSYRSNGPELTSCIHKYFQRPN